MEGFRPALMLALPLLVGAAPTTSSPGEGWPPPASLVRHPEPIVIPQDELSQGAFRRARPDLLEFLSRHPGWKATLDPYTQSVDRAFGDGLPVAGAGDAEQQARAFLSDHRRLLAPGLEISGATLVLNAKASRRLADPAVLVTRFDLYQHDLPVLGAGLTLAARNGSVMYLSSSVLGPVAVSPIPKVDLDEAVSSVREYLESGPGPGVDLTVRREPSLAFYPRLDRRGGVNVLRHHLVLIFEVKPEPAPFHEWYIAYVDAHDGEVLAFFPEAQTSGSCDADPGEVHATVRGGVRPNRADDAEVVLNFPFARVDVDGTLLDAGLNGRYPYTGGTATSTLQGKYFRVHCDNCTNPTQPTAGDDGSGDIDFGTGGDSASAPIDGNGTSTPADRSAFFHLNQARSFLDKWDNAFFEEIDAFVNINQVCNAFSSGHILGFYVDASSCNNTGEIRDVVQHELGHTWDRLDGNGITSDATSEWKSDIMALLIGGDSCVGESFRKTGGPTSACSGVRDIDEKAPGRTDHPATPAECPTCATLTLSSNNCSGVHCFGELPGQATWHLMNNLLTGNDYITGAPLGGSNPAIPAEHARWILERLLIAGGPPMQTFNPTAAGVSIYDALMLADDADGNLANGTPHAQYINAAFSHHELEESPMITDSANCPALADPAVTATVDRDAPTGLPAVRLEWTPDGGTTYDVLRNTRAGDAFLPLAQDVTSGTLVDVGVQVGVTYRYFVAAARKTGCAAISPGANIQTVTVEPAELQVLSAVVAEVPAGSDNDGLIEPGEQVTIDVTLEEIGGADAATNVTATMTGTSAASTVVSPGPVTFGTVPAGGSSMGASAYEVFLGPSEGCGGAVQVVLSAAGDDGCWQDIIEIPLATSGAGCGATPGAFVEVVPGSATNIGAAGDADGIADNCETTTIEYAIRNAGSLASGSVTSTASTAAPGVTISPVDDCTVSNLDPNESALCQFSFSLSGATSTGVPFTLTADSMANPAPSVLDVVVDAETDPPVFSTQSFGFEGSFEGWTPRLFDVSSARQSAGSNSAHAGSTTQANLCTRLTSPPFLLDPSMPSTLSFQLFAVIEPFDAPTGLWYDRANVHIVDLDTNQHTLVAPSSGTAYNASGNAGAQLCHLSGQNGWAGDLGGFALQTFDLSAFAGRRIQVEINYDTDEGLNLEGIYVDEVTITRAAGATPPADPQADACMVPEVSAPGAPVPLTVVSLPGDVFRIAWEDLGPGFQYNLYPGTIGTWYDHGTSPLICSGLGSGVTCDGTTCTFDQPGAGLPAGSLYFVVTATAFGSEGTSGFPTTGPERDPAQNTCAP